MLRNMHIYRLIQIILFCLFLLFETNTLLVNSQFSDNNINDNNNDNRKEETIEPKSKLPDIKVHFTNYTSISSLDTLSSYLSDQ